jgi:DNA sulfur modification protein DndB
MAGSSSTLQEKPEGVQEPEFEYIFPAIRGIQAGREFYVSMCPLRVIPRIFTFKDEELRPELRAQRVLNKARLPEITRYIVDNKHGYVFSALTASVDAPVVFEPLGGGGGAKAMGQLRIPMEARFIINDGQHRQAAITKALSEKPELANETIAVVFFLDIGLVRCQQMFADLNRYAIRPSTSLGVLYDHRDPHAEITRLLISEFPLFQDLVEMERSNLSPRSRKLFTLSAVHSATESLLGGMAIVDVRKAANLTLEFWDATAKNFPEWRAVYEGKMSAGEVRRDFIHSHGVLIQALGRAGNSLLVLPRQEWKNRLKRLRSINWRRSNAQDWEGRALSGGRLSKAGQHVALATNFVKTKLGIQLTPEERRAERAFKRGDHGD